MLWQRRCTGLGCCYKQTNDMRVLAEKSPFNPTYKDTIWAIKASAWGQSK